MSDEETSSPGRHWTFKVPRIDKYFLEEKHPFTGRSIFNMKRVGVFVAIIIVISVFALLFFGSKAEERVQNAQASINPGDLPHKGMPSGSEGSPNVGGPGNFGSGIALSGSVQGQMSNPRQYGASQIVKNGEGVGNGFGLPMGSTITARLLNSLLSSDSAQPVIAEVSQDGVWKNSVLIPLGAKAIGTASFDSVANRLQVRFHTFVYPEGDQHPVSAVALLENGSSGIPGDFHSGATKKQVGQFLGNFVSGLADGMKDRQAAGQAGIPFEPGSLKNGVLNGVTISALDQAKSFSEGIQNIKPYLEVAGGTSFLIYFEKEYMP